MLKKCWKDSVALGENYVDVGFCQAVVASVVIPRTSSSSTSVYSFSLIVNA